MQLYRGLMRDWRHRRDADPALLAAWLASGYWVTRYYRRLIAEHGLSPHALAERADQKSRAFYDHLFHDVSLPTPLTVLDIGCGMGDVITYLQAQQMRIADYLGLDLVEIFVRACQQRYGAPYHFQRGNFIHPAFQPSARYALVVNMGGMVSRVVGYEAYIAYCCEKMLRFATHTVLFNVITNVQPTLGNYANANRVGQITMIAKPRLESILDAVTAGTPWNYTLRDAQIYPDATDTFVYLRRQ